MNYEKTKWIRVRKGSPCPICQKVDWCSVSDDGSVAFCMRVASDKPVTTQIGTGYIHRLTESVKKEIRRRPKPKPVIQRTLSPEQWFELAMRYRADADLNALSDALSVSVAGLDCYEVGFGQIEYHNKDGEPFVMQGWTFPMRKADDTICGIRTRHGTFKGSVSGSESGLFLPEDLRSGGDLIICEGATDPIALHDIGLNAIGRASCNSNEQDIIELINRIKPDRIVILSDNDKPKSRPDGTLWYPGQEGAKQLAQTICNMADTRIIKPLRAKDAREWKARGLTQNLFYSIVKLAGRISA